MSERTPDAFDQIVRGRPPIASVKRIFAIAKQENFRRRKGAAPDPRLGCASSILNHRNLDAIDSERASIAAYMLARNCREPFDESVAFVVVLMRGGFYGSNVACAHGHKHPAGRITRLPNVKADGHRWTVIEQHDILSGAVQNERGQRQSGAA